jgi:hypothetical protein
MAAPPVLAPTDGVIHTHDPVARILEHAELEANDAA